MKNIFKKLKTFVIKHPIIFQLLLCIGGSCMVSIPFAVFAAMNGMKHSFGFGVFFGGFLSAALGATLILGIISFPIIVTVYEAISLLVALRKGNITGEDNEYTRVKAIPGMLYDFFILFVGVFLE